MSEEFDFSEFDFDIDKFEIREGVEGVWHYHLAEGGRKNTLCGEPSMSTELDVHSWRQFNPSHLPISFCNECEEKAKSIG